MQIYFRHIYLPANCKIPHRYLHLERSQSCSLGNKPQLSCMWSFTPSSAHEKDHEGKKRIHINYFYFTLLYLLIFLINIIRTFWDFNISKFVLKVPKQMMKNSHTHNLTLKSSCCAIFNERYLTRILMFFGWYGVQAGQ